MKCINTNIINYCLRENKVNQLKLHIYLSRAGNGIIKIDKEFINKAFIKLGYKTKKTFKNNLQRLLKDNWIGYNPKTGFYFIRSLNRLFAKSKTRYKIFDHNLKDFRGFLSACVIKSACKAVKFSKKLDFAEHSDIALQKSDDNGQLISNSYLANRGNFTLSKARRLKLSMVKAGYGTVIRVYNVIDFAAKHVSNLNKFTDRYCFHRKGITYITLPDRCKVNLIGIL